PHEKSSYYTGRIQLPRAEHVGCFRGTQGGYVLDLAMSWIPFCRTGNTQESPRWTSFWVESNFRRGLHSYFSASDQGTTQTQPRVQRGLGQPPQITTSAHISHTSGVTKVRFY